MVFKERFVLESPSSSQCTGTGWIDGLHDVPDARNDRICGLDVLSLEIVRLVSNVQLEV